jgi:hypothetical protein
LTSVKVERYFNAAFTWPLSSGQIILTRTGAP